ncbi:hypothetical protein GCM10025869_05860 [Homoserinibacter gongjuensis]|uniref:Uncharacterized protein n=1 Tax=Homoserinibacter gongjuensis TaxID=1162968 RepID=A0ABQ6JP42_9MICO|nr:hypothetical protein GCM10025869_05860 [Homoserinibacter gongjuensis]
MARDPEGVGVVVGGWFRDAACGGSSPAGGACGGSSTSWGACGGSSNRERTWNEGPDRASDPSQDSSQGDNPNIALTRPHIIGLLTLDDR